MVPSGASSEVEGPNVDYPLIPPHKRSVYNYTTIEFSYGHPLTTCDIGQETPSPKASRLQLDMVELLAGCGDPNKLRQSDEKERMAMV